MEKKPPVLKRHDPYADYFPHHPLWRRWLHAVLAFFIGSFLIRALVLLLLLLTSNVFIAILAGIGLWILLIIGITYLLPPKQGAIVGHILSIMLLFPCYIALPWLWKDMPRWAQIVLAMAALCFFSYLFFSAADTHYNRVPVAAPVTRTY